MGRVGEAPDSGEYPRACPIHGEGPCGIGGAGGTVCCWSCHKVEKVTPFTYRVCFECGHAWTRWGLSAAYRRITKEMGHGLLWRWWRSRWWRISFCQECIHDW